ncbi:NUDIX domain-containing protein [Streptomyces xanthochromogenes]|uniref:NUDIX domain-containing protein n=1 Tax=Streptomyces TaxID=1883 RepID=UPI00136A72DC|nr:NUDIX domain-containing protein [Streptomyces sp. SID1034]MYV95985.1 NUDIX domain-containing protein [Streptomyces sp. SID1034]
MSDSTFTVTAPITDVHVIVRNGQEILLSQRGGSYGHGQWHLPSGKLELQGKETAAEPASGKVARRNETPAEAASRELREETGLVADPETMTLRHTVIHHQGDGTPDRLGLFFETTKYAGDVANREPDKCLALRWFAEHNLPDNLIPYPAVGLNGSLTQPGGLSYHGWPEH